jgi:surface antigen
MHKEFNMNNFFLRSITLVFISIVMTACTTSTWMPMRQQPEVVKGQEATYVSSSGQTGTLAQVKESRVPIAGNVGRSMDEIDRSKMWHALDNPVGKSTTWVSGRSGTTYTITPTKKVNANGNQICRRYSTTAVRDGQTREMVGTACVSSDGNWHPVD